MLQVTIFEEYMSDSEKAIFCLYPDTMPRYRSNFLRKSMRR